MTAMLLIAGLASLVPLTYLTYVHVGSRWVLFRTLVSTSCMLPSIVRGSKDNGRFFLRWENLKTQTHVVAEGQSCVVGFDWYDDHADVQWEHVIFRFKGQLYAEQRTYSYGHAARHWDGLFINGRKLRKGEVRKIPDGASVYQLDRFGQGPRIVKLDLREAVALRLVA